jgi:hypothetical protein
MAKLLCHHCGTPVSVDEPIGREQTFDGCGRDLRACVQCRHYDTRYNNSCTETQADPVQDKERRNFCEFFYFSREPFVAGAPTKDRAAEARAKLDALFKKKDS